MENVLVNLQHPQRQANPERKRPNTVKYEFFAPGLSGRVFYCEEQKNLFSAVYPKHITKTAPANKFSKRPKSHLSHLQPFGRIKT